MNNILKIVIAGFMILGGAQAARADYSIWRDVDTGLSLSFPDTWQQTNNANPDDIVTIMAPSGRAHASCSIKARADGRYLVYPPRFSDEIQKFDFSEAFWERYLGAYDHHVINIVYDGAGLGRGFASYADASYRSEVPGPYMRRRGLMFATLYNDTQYILDCSSHADAFDKWKPLFLSIAKSVDFRPAHSQTVGGNYRNFLKDPYMLFAIPGTDAVTYY